MTQTSKQQFRHSTRSQVGLMAYKLFLWSPLILVIGLLTSILVSNQAAWQWFMSMDQRGDHYFKQGEYIEAAGYYTDPLRIGAARFRAGDFNAAVTAFNRSNSAEGFYNLGNAQIMLGEYEAAIEAYDRALDFRPGWEWAETNRTIAKLRAQRLATEGGDMTGGMVEADDFVFDSKPGQGGENQTVEGNDQTQISDDQLQATWLRRVQTRPADFLQSRFAWQLAAAETEPETNGAGKNETAQDPHDSQGLNP